MEEQQHGVNYNIEIDMSRYWTLSTKNFIITKTKPNFET